MGRKSNAKKQRKQGQLTSIDQHERQGKKLIAPYMQIENMKPVSWVNQRLPEYIWLALIFCQHEREDAIELLKVVGKFFYNLEEDLRPQEYSISGLAEMEEQVLNEFLDLLNNTLDFSAYLRPLMLFEDLPGKQHWGLFLDSPIPEEDWDILFMTVAKCFNHQSQESTDCRWARLLFKTVTRKLHIPEHLFYEIVRYPYQGDMRMVRPSIRSLEMVLDMKPSNGEVNESEWCEFFWKNGYEKTPCWDINLGIEIYTEKSILIEKLNDVQTEIRKHFFNTNSTTGFDAKHDAIFGITLYCLYFAS